jgi:transcriptional regulator with XRE-family HTH domain
MKIVSIVKQARGVTAYRLAKEIGVTQQTVRRWLGVTKTRHPNEAINLRVLCKLRKVSGMSWSAFGKELDQEFGEIDSNE